MQDEKYTVYIKADEAGRIIAVNSSAFLMDQTGYIAIDEGVGDKYHHAQGNYFDRPLYDEQGCHNYIYDDAVRLATDEEKAAEKASWPRQEPTEEELQWQAITDIEIEQMEQDQAITDLEIAQLEGGSE